MIDADKIFEEWFEQKKDKCEVYGNGDDFYVDDEIKKFCKLGYDFGRCQIAEWHYVKDGDLPKDEDYKYCISSNGIYYIARYEELFVNWTNQEHKEVCCPYAWKEIIPPKEIE